MKKIFSLLLVFVLLFSVTAYASTENKIASDEIIHEQKIQALKKSNIKFLNEYEMLKLAKESKSNIFSLSSEELDYVKNGSAEKDLKKGMLKRSKLTKKELASLGYSEEQIVKLKQISTETSLDEISVMGLFGTCYVDTSKISHYYNSSADKTYFTVRFDWEWDLMPFSPLGEDRIVMAWNHDFRASSAKHTIKYTNPDLATQYVTTNLTEYDFNTYTDSFEVSVDHYPVNSFGRKGWGTIYLYQDGEANNAKFAFCYAKNSFGTSPTISSGGISFSINNAETLYYEPVLNSTY